MIRNTLKQYYEKTKKLSPPMKASMAFTLGDFMQKGIAVMTVPLFTRLLSEQTYGIVSIYNSWAWFLEAIVIFCLKNGGVVNNGMLDFEEDRDTFLSSLLSLISFSTITYYLAYKIFQSKVESFLGLGNNLMTIMFIGFIVDSATTLWMVKEKYQYKYKMVIAMNIIKAILTPFIIYYLLTQTSLEQSFSRIMGGAIIPIIVGGIVATHIFSKAKKMFKIKYWGYALKFSIPLIPHYLSMIILAQSDRVMIAKFDGNAKVGIYSLAYTAASLIMILFDSINASFTPWTYKKMKEKLYGEVGAQSKKLMVLGAGCSILFILFAPEMVKIMAPSSYYDAIYIIPPVVLGNYFMFMYGFFRNIEFYHKKTKNVMIASIGIAILNIILNLIFIPMFGYIAAGYTTMVGYLGMAIIHYYFMKKIEKNNIYDIKFMILISLFLVSASLVALFLYDLVIIRYIAILMLFTTIFIYRKKIIGIFEDK